MATLRELLELQQKGIKTTKRKRSNNEEHHLQCAEVRYMRAFLPEYDRLFFAVPNGQKRTILQTSWLHDEGMVNGVSDMIFLVPNSKYSYLCIENKTAKGKQSADQILFQEAVEKNGGKYVVIRDIDTFAKVITDYLKDKV